MKRFVLHALKPLKQDNMDTFWLLHAGEEMYIISSSYSVPKLRYGPIVTTPIIKKTFAGGYKITQA